MADEVELELACVDRLSDPLGRPVNIKGRYLGVQQEECVRQYGHGCEFIVNIKAINLAPRIFAFLDPAHEKDTFSFTNSKVLLDSASCLHTDFGRLHCLPDAEYQLWKDARFCQVAPLVIFIDGVMWRVIASEDAVVNDDEIKLADDMNPVFKLYLRAHKEGGKLLEEVKTAVARGEQNLKEHRSILFKVFAVIGIPPTLSHDLTKTSLVNFCLGIKFHSDGLDLVKSLLSNDECISLIKRLHLEVENHHPEHGARPALDVRDMYLDRVARGIEKTHGWKNKAWHIPDRYTPDEYEEDFARLEKKYGSLQLEDPGEITVADIIPGASLNIIWEDFNPVRAINP